MNKNKISTIKKRVISSFLTATMTLSCFLGTNIGINSIKANALSDSEITQETTDLPKDNTVSAPFEGKGTQEDPYLISSKENLKQMRDLVNDTSTNAVYGHAYYKQTADIDLENESWTPIGLGHEGADGKGNYCKKRMFFGSYDGGCHYIKGLNVDGDWKTGGLFAYVAGKDSIVTDLVVYGTVKNATEVSGGIIGVLLDASNISECGFNGDVSGSDKAGGLVGEIWEGGDIFECYHVGNVSGTNVSGGIVARIGFDEHDDENHTSSSVSDCYQAGGKVNGKLAGAIAAECTSLKEEYNSANIHGYVFNDCGADLETKNATQQDVRLLEEDYMSEIKKYPRSSFSNSPYDALNHGYPVFKWEIVTYYKENESILFEGKGTQENPYLIASKENLEQMRDLVNDPRTNPVYGHAYYKQTADIDLENESWTPIGIGCDVTYKSDNRNDTTRMFFGSYDGGEHYIKGLNVDRSNLYSGLFSYVSGEGSVSNLVVYGESDNGLYPSGSIAGCLQNGAVIQNCGFIGSVFSDSCAGGIVGIIYDGGKILNCYHIGRVAGCGGGGGIAGYIMFTEDGKDSDSVEIKNCYHVGDTYVDGCAIAAECIYSEGKKNTAIISNCYASDNYGYYNPDGEAFFTAANATSDTTVLVKQIEMKKLAEKLGSAFVDSPEGILTNGYSYPVFPWEITTTKTNPVKGDLNNDGKVNLKDLTILRRYYEGGWGIELNEYDADINKNGVVDFNDVDLLRWYIAGGWGVTLDY